MLVVCSRYRFPVTDFRSRLEGNILRPLLLETGQVLLYQILCGLLEKASHRLTRKVTFKREKVVLL
jgi:hypothetical protein